MTGSGVRNPLLRAAPLLLASGLVMAGCGYHVGGHADVMPRTMKIIAVPPLRNATAQPRLGTLLTADITREFISRTRYTIVSEPAAADATLTGMITNFANFPTIIDPTSGRATGVEVIVTMQLTLTDRRTGKVLFSRVGAEFRERYEVALDPQQYFDESGTAILRVSRDVARSVVSAVLESF